MRWKSNQHPAGEHRSVAEDAVVSFPGSTRSSAEGCTAVDLVYQAAQVLQSIEDRAAETTARAQHLVRQAAEKIQVSKQHISELEASNKLTETALQEANARADEAERAVRSAEAHFTELETRVVAAEQRARNAETRMMQAEQSLVQIEDAIRTQLLSRGQDLINRARAA